MDSAKQPSLESSSPLPSSLEINRYLVLSTGHITQADAQQLEADAHAKDEYGYWLYIDEGFKDLSESFQKCAALTKKCRCQYLRLDCDGPLVTGHGLDTHEW